MSLGTETLILSVLQTAYSFTFAGEVASEPKASKEGVFSFRHRLKTQ